MKNVKTIIALILLLTVSSTLFSQNKITFMTYNLLNYPDASSTRNPYFKKIIEAVKPDLLVVDEMKNTGGVTNFLTNVLDTSFAAATFIQGYDTNNELYYRKSIFTFISNVPIHTALRDINQFKVVNKLTLDTLLIYSAHLKASSGSTNEQKRLEEVIKLRAVTDALPANTDYILCGDFNLYNSSEPAYQALINQTNPGYFIDPSRAGNWHNNSAYKDIHTQATRVNQVGGDGSWGGLDDRFDFIFFSEAINQSIGINYVANSYHSFGNDGNHFNQSINSGTNTAVSQAVANALYYASDHLPVIAQFDFGPTVSVSDNNIISKFELSQNYPNPFNPSTTISYSIPKEQFVTLKIYNSIGQYISTLVNKNEPAGKYQINFDAGKYSSGIYFYKLNAGNFSKTKKMMLLK